MYIVKCVSGKVHVQQFDSLMHDICSVGHIRIYLIIFPHIVMVLWRFVSTNLMTGFSSLPCYPDSSCGSWNEGRFDSQQGCGEGGRVLVFSFSLWSAPHLLYIPTCAHTQSAISFCVCTILDVRNYIQWNLSITNL